MRTRAEKVVLEARAGASTCISYLLDAARQSVAPVYSHFSDCEATVFASHGGGFAQAIDVLLNFFGPCSTKLAAQVKATPRTVMLSRSALFHHVQRHSQVFFQRVLGFCNSPSAV
jgi:hypothetical protein